MNKKDWMDNLEEGFKSYKGIYLSDKDCEELLNILKGKLIEGD